MYRLQAGAAAVAVELREDCFPNAEFTGIHDDVYVRCILVKSNDVFALLSVDMPSMHPSDIRYCKEVLKEEAGIDPSMSWVTVNHSFSAPHLFHEDSEKEMNNMVLPKELKDDSRMNEKAENINRAYYKAISEAVRQAFSSLRDAAIGFQEGSCNININRNMHTVDGWWQGVNHESFADHALPVIKIEDLSGAVIAVIYNYSCQSSVTQGSILPDGGKLVSADLPGAASSYIEREFPGCTAIFLPGATDDQVPMYKINYTETDAKERLRTGSYGKEGYLLLEEQGRMLGNAVVSTARETECADRYPEISAKTDSCTCECQKRDADMSHLKPSLNYEFLPDGQCELPIHLVQIGDIALIGLLPEMDGVNIASVRERSPLKKILVATFVNGNEKSMPRESSYSLLQYGAMNSPFAAGSAEKYCEAALNMIRKEIQDNRSNRYEPGL